MFPFFIGGYYLKRSGTAIFHKDYKIKYWAKCLLIIGTILMTIFLYLGRNYLKASWAYHSTPYASSEYNVGIRVFFIVAAIIYTSFLCVFVSNRKIPFLTYIGQNTLPIFILHGFIIRFLAYKNILGVIPQSIIVTCVLSILIIILCSNKAVKIMFSWIVGKA